MISRPSLQHNLSPQRVPGQASEPEPPPTPRRGLLSPTATHVGGTGTGPRGRAACSASPCCAWHLSADPVLLRLERDKFHEKPYTSLGSGQNLAFSLPFFHVSEVGPWGSPASRSHPPPGSIPGGAAGGRGRTACPGRAGADRHQETPTRRRRPADLGLSPAPGRRGRAEGRQPGEGRHDPALRSGGRGAGSAAAPTWRPRGAPVQRPHEGPRHLLGPGAP